MQQERQLKLRHTSAAHHALAMLRAHAQLGLPSASLPLTLIGERGEEKRPQEQQKQSAPQEQQQNHHLDHQQQQQRQQHDVHKKKSKINNDDNVVEPSSHCGASDAISMKEVVTDSLVVKDEYSGLQLPSQQPHQQQQQLSTIPPNVRLVGVRPVDSVPLSYYTSLPRRPLSSTIDVSFPVEIEPKPETELVQGQGEEKVDTRNVKTQGTGEEEEDCTPSPSTPAQKKARQRARKEQLRQWRARQSRNSREERATARKRRNAATKANPADTKICSSNSLAAAVRREEQSLSHSQTRSVTFASTVEFHVLPTETI